MSYTMFESHLRMIMIHNLFFIFPGFLTESKLERIYLSLNALNLGEDAKSLIPIEEMAELYIISAMSFISCFPRKLYFVTVSHFLFYFKH